MNLLIFLGAALPCGWLAWEPEGWQNVRKKAGLLQVRVHDLKHTFDRRLRTAGVPLETRKVHPPAS